MVITVESFMILLLFCCSNDISRCYTTEQCLRSSLNRNSIIALFSDEPVSFVCGNKNNFFIPTT